MCLEKLIPKWGVWGDVKACPMCLEIGLAHGPMIPHRNPLDSQVAVHLQQLMPPGDMGQELSVVTLILIDFIDFIDINSLICLGISWKQRSYSTLCRHTFQLFCLVMGICESCFVFFFFWRRNPDTDPFDQLSPRLYLVSEYIWKRIVQCPGGSPRPDRLAEVWSKGFLCDVLGMGAIWHFGWEANGASKTQTIRDYPIDVPFFCVNDLIHGGLDAIQRLHPHGLAQRQHPRSRFQFQREVWPSFQSLAPLGKLLAGKLVWSEFKTQRPAEFSTHPSLGATPVASPQGERHLELSLARVSQYFRAAMARCQRQCGPQIWGQTEGKIPISSEIWLTKNRDWMIPRKE